MGNSEKALVILYTGPGKGKTTAALGLAVRVAGHGERVLLVQFLKGQESGEVTAVRRLPEIEVIRVGLPHFVNPANPSEEDRRLAHEGLVRAAEALRSGTYRLVILDEVNVAAGYGLIGAVEVLAAIAGRAPGVDVVLTGRDAPAEFFTAADLITVMQEVKHPYQSGTPARAGIEY